MQKPITWKDLTKDEQKNFGNGCGSTISKFLIPDLIWGEVCNHHDFNFWRGGGITRFLKTNLVFLAWCIIKICDNSTKAWHIPLYFITAVLYFLAVMTFGALLFEWGKEKTVNDWNAMKH